MQGDPRSAYAASRIEGAIASAADGAMRDALSLLDPGFHFQTGTQPTLFGNTAVRMENSESVLRYHTTTEKGLYAVLIPQSLDEKVIDICRSLQVFTVNASD